MPIQFTDPALQTNESFKGFETSDDLGKSYLELHGKVSSGSIDLLPEDIRKDPAISRYKNLTELSRGLVETQKMVGGIEKAPEKPEMYKVSTVQGLHADIKAEGILKSLLPIFHSAGVGNTATDKIQQGILKTLSDLTVQQEAKKAETLKTNETALRGEWGGAYEARMDKIQKIWAQVGGEGEVKKSGLKNIQALAKLTGFLSEDSLKSLGEGPAAPITDAAGAQKEIDVYTKEINTMGKAHPYWNEKDPKHEEAVEKMHKLHGLLAVK